MSASCRRWFLVACVAILCAGCAASPESQARRQAAEDEIIEILSVPFDDSQSVKTQRCLSDHEFRNFRALDDRRILFEGRSGRLWLNTLRSRCPDLQHADVLRLRSTFSLSRICEHDRFVPDDWFSWPWYRRWPWHWGGAWGTGMSCTLGEFQAVTVDQVRAIDEVLGRK
jgi:hypothetical protein